MKIVSELRGRRTLISAVITAVVVLALVLSGPGFSANLMYSYGVTGYGYGYGYTAGEASDESGVIKNEYTTDETVYAVGSGFIPGSQVEVTITEDKHWTDGKSINSTIYQQKVVNTSGSGNILDPIWPDPIPGEYDMIFNINPTDNTYDPLGGDVVDDPNEPGFIVVGIVPALTPLGVIALIGLLSVIVALSITIRKRR
jgi:hypothetical protein